ncbi:MAG: hypothetical protein KDA96_22440 [Planctomycetaceae bacterium]|nr:hypothetical protein [Planctomycetaceae bacterium]
MKLLLPQPQNTRFSLGNVIITANAQSRLTGVQVINGLARHASGDWGDLSPEDAEENNRAVDAGDRIFSAYGRGERRFWIITEADRSLTTVLLPEDY